LGNEPDPATAPHARSIGLDVIEGYLTDAPSLQARFDLIAFNDVFEHLPDPKSAALASSACLRPGGMLLLTLPSSKGALFRIARTLSTLGFSGPLDRMWQRLTYDHLASRPHRSSRCFIYCLPIIQLFPADIAYPVFRKAAAQDAREQGVTMDSDSAPRVVPAADVTN
jgi:hypothetical protein